ncbi:heme-binding protein [Mycobacterium saskatchewanense]|nr:heme-binding protein [Mycobacterium saskatchewanense]
MFRSGSTPRRLVASAMGAAALTGTLWGAAAGIATADAPPRPPNCTSADVAGVATGVGAALTTYLFAHPELNAFYTGLQDQPKDRIHEEVQNYFNAHPEEQADLENIRQPLAAIRQRCRWTLLLGESSATP